MGNSLLYIGGEADSGRGVVWRVVVDENDNVSVEEPVPLPLLAGAPQGMGQRLKRNERRIVPGDRTLRSATTIPWKPLSGRSPSIDDGTLRPGPAISLVTEPRLFLGLRCQHRWGRVRATWQRLPFVAPAGQTAQLLPLPRYTTWGVANSINNLGEIVGQLEIYPKGAWSGIMSGKAGNFAYLWKEGTPIDLTKQIDPAAGWLASGVRP